MCFIDIRKEKADEYSSLEDALYDYVFDFDHCVAYGIGIYDQEANILHLPSYFDKKQQKWAIEEVKRLRYKVRNIQIFEL